MTDRALEWMSYRRSGKIGDLAGDLIGAASERRFVDDMVTLGHAEWTASNAWRIASPMLGGLRRDGEFAAVLCGARTPKLLGSLAAACSAAGARLSAEHRGDRPAKVVVVASSQELLGDVAVQGESRFKVMPPSESWRARRLSASGHARGAQWWRGVSKLSAGSPGPSCTGCLPDPARLGLGKPDQEQCAECRSDRRSRRTHGRCSQVQGGAVDRTAGCCRCRRSFIHRA
jgi:hypothetical protein